MPIKAEGKQCSILLDSGSSASIVDESFLLNHLNKNRSHFHGPIGCVKGVGKTVINDKGRVDLKLNILGKDYIEEFIIHG